MTCNGLPHDDDEPGCGNISTVVGFPRPQSAFVYPLYLCLSCYEFSIDNLNPYFEFRPMRITTTVRLALHVSIPRLFSSLSDVVALLEDS